MFVRNGLVYPLSGLAPRQKDRWVFGHTRGLFAGNPKYLFLWMALHRHDIKVTWITGSRRTRDLLVRNGLDACLRNSWRGRAAALRAKVFVFAHGVASVDLTHSRGAFLLNLWHGVGLKAIALGWTGGRAAEASAHRGRAAKLRDLHHTRHSDLVVTTSDAMQAHFADQFRLPPERCPQLGYPRLDCAFDNELAAKARRIDADAGFSMNPEGFVEIYIYLPTFRDSGRPFLEEALPDLDRLSQALEARGALLYIKPHLRTGEAFADTHRNIRLWPEEVDFYTYLADFTGLITDYSSVLYDYLFLKDRGAILYTFDYQEYLSNDRTLLYPFDDNVAGLRVETFDGLCEALAKGSALGQPAEGTDIIRERFWGGSSRPASPAIVGEVEKRVKIPAAVATHD